MWNIYYREEDFPVIMIKVFLNILKKKLTSNF